MSGGGDGASVCLENTPGILTPAACFLITSFLMTLEQDDFLVLLLLNDQQHWTVLHSLLRISLQFSLHLTGCTVFIFLAGSSSWNCLLSLGPVLWYFLVPPSRWYHLVLWLQILASKGVLVNVQSLIAQEKKKVLICNVCQFPWPISSCPRVVTECGVGKRCTQSALRSWDKPAPSFPINIHIYLSSPDSHLNTKRVFNVLHLNFKPSSQV